MTYIPGSGGGNHNYYSAYASPPGSPVAGDLWLPSDGVHILVYSGSVWVPRGIAEPMTLPTIGSAWVNQGGATCAVVGGAVVLYAPASTTQNMRIRTFTAPSLPYTFTVKMRVTGKPATDYFDGGIGWRESGTGEVVGIGVGYAGGQRFAIAKFDSPTVYNSDYVNFSGALLYEPTWLRIREDASNREVYTSQDGFNWEKVHTIGRTDFLTADQYVIYANAPNATAGRDTWATFYSMLQA